MLKSIRTFWYQKDYYLIKEEGNFFKLYVNNVYYGETRNYLNFNSILPFNFNEMDINFINELSLIHKITK